MDFPIDWVRAQFPALREPIDGAPAAFFDGPGGTQVPGSVINAIGAYCVRANANRGGSFATSRRTEDALAAARQAAAELLGCGAQEIVFGANMTSITFALSRAIGRDLQAGDEIIVTTLDHDANVAPWRALAERGVAIRQVDIHPQDCTLDLQDLERQLTSRTRLVAIAYASNVVGTINPVARVARLAHDAGALVFVDAVHYAPHGLIDVAALDCDFLACSAYKFFGPHLGLLYGKPALLERFAPYKVRPAKDRAPDRWETGTQAHELIAALPAAVDYLVQLGRRSGGIPGGSGRAAIGAAFEAIGRYERAMLAPLIRQLQDLPGLTIYGIVDRARLAERCATLAMRIDAHDSHALAQALGSQGICVWDGDFYAPGLIERLGVGDAGGLLRIGLVHYNTEAEVQRLVGALGAAVRG